MDFIGDNLTKIRNAVKARKRTTIIRYSKVMQKIISIMKEYGFIKDFSLIEEGNKKFIKINLKYSPKTGQSVIHEIKRVSTPGRHIYVSSKKLPSIKNNMGIAILTTDKGILTERDCKKLKVGGELICTIW